MVLLDVHVLNWSHKLRASAHVTNKWMTDSFSCLQSEHKEELTISNLNKRSFK